MEHFCHCPQKCKSKLSKEKWDELFERFYNLGDQSKQNQFLQSHIVIKAVHLHNWENEKTNTSNKRRVTCKYHVPNLSEDSDLEDYVNRKGNDSIEVCQKAFMNCYGITEKRVRMQRERCISRLAPDHYKNSPFGKKQKITPDGDTFNHKVIDFGSEIEITPLDLSNDKKRKSNVDQLEKVHNNTVDYRHSNGKDQPLDLSCSNESSRSAASADVDFDFDKTSLYEIAHKMGLPRETIDKEMAEKFEEYLRKNLKKSQIGLTKNRKRHALPRESQSNYKTEIENRSPKATGVSEQVAGLEQDLSVLPIQTLNNGDLTITPVLSSVPKPVETRDLMRVNSFFQNQLWQPELIGLSSWKKLRSQSFDI
ncbi:UNVERIFIED_CONTAM: hypothetical protein PYX00_008203 [Menopon gallinae]|uniref:Uncharacterized protein n=1 Tax=Menopon gallinae TaxID=328185 RepID=A0AAW2HLU1_9NEOP